MGMLEMAGALGGIGKGIEKNVDFERQKELMSLEEAREMRIRQFEAEQAAARQSAGFGHEEKMQEKGFGQQKELQKGGFEHEEGMQEKGFGQQEKMQKGQQTFESGERAKDRASREKIAGISANAKAAKDRASAMAKRWESKVVKRTTVDAKGLPTESDVLSVFDRSTARTYEQEGNKFFPQGAPRTRKTPGAGKEQPAREEPIRDAARSEIQKLIENPDQADNFVRLYGYLPYEFFNGAGSNAGTFSSSSDEGADTDADEE